MADKIFATGLFYNPPREGAPEFVLGSLSIKPAEFIKFLNDNKDGDYINLDILRSKGGKPYVALNTYKKSEQKVVDTTSEEENLPF